MERQRLAQHGTGNAGVSGIAMPSNWRPTHVPASFSLNLSGNAATTKQQYRTGHLGGPRP